MINKTISHFKIVAELGAGGMGIVYLAEDLTLTRKTAIKFFSNEYTADKDLLARFEQEAKLTASLNHPNIVTIYEMGSYSAEGTANKHDNQPCHASL